MDADKQVAALKTLFGQWAIQGAAKLTGNLDAFTDALGMVNDPSLYNGSMEREFIIKASTSGAIDTMMSNSFQALQIDVGTAFLPAKKEISLALIDFMNQLRNMPELGTIAEQLATLFSQGVQWAGEALENALPYIQQALDYLINHGPEVVDVLGKLAAAFAAMKFAPGITNLLGGAGNLIFGAKTGAEKTQDKTGGLTGMISGLFKGGQRVPTRIATAVSFAHDAAGMAQASELPAWQGGITGFFGAMKNMPGLMSGGKGTTSAIENMNNLIQSVTNNHGLFGAIKSSISRSGAGQYLGNVGSSLGNFLNQSGISGFARGTVNVSGEILSNISQATGLTDFVHGSIGLVKTGAGKAAGGVARMASNVANSAPVQAIGGLAGRVVNSAPVQGIASMTKGAAGWIGSTVSSGAGLLSSTWGPMASGFGSIVSGALPIVGVISSVIAASSLLYDNMDGLGQIVRSVFGEDAFQGFQKFQDGLDGVVNSVGMLLSGDFAGFTASLREALFGKYDVFTESMMGGLFSGSGADALAGTFDSLMAGDVTGALAPLREKLFGAFDMDTGTMMGGMFSGSGANILVGIFDTLATGAQAIVNIVGPVFQSIMGVVGQVVDFANTTVKPIIQEIFTFITQTVMPVILQIFTAAAPIVSGIISNLGTATMTVAQIIGTAIQTVLPIVKNIISVIMSVASVVVPAVLTGIEALSAGIIPIIEEIQTVFNGLIPST